MLLFLLGLLLELIRLELMKLESMKLRSMAEKALTLAWKMLLGAIDDLD